MNMLLDEISTLLHKMRIHIERIEGLTYDIAAKASLRRITSLLGELDDLVKREREKDK